MAREDDLFLGPSWRNAKILIARARLINCAVYTGSLAVAATLSE